MTEDKTTSMDWHREKVRRVFTGLAVGLGVFGTIGTITSVWTNPFFQRMTPVGDWELSATFLMGLFSAITAGFWTTTCGIRRSAGGGLAGFLGIACPTCNKILMLLFGAPAVLAWFDPIRPLLAAAGLVAMGWAALVVFRRFERPDLAARADRKRFTGDIE